MTPALNVLICGKVRDKVGFTSDLAVYRRWLEEASVARVVFCGWDSEQEDSPETLAEMREIGIEVVLIPEPSFRVVHHTFHQMKTLHYGLAMFDDDDVVIKSRPDKVWLQFDPLAVGRKIAEAAPVGPMSPFQQRVLIAGGLALHPFFFNDMIFAGRVGDLKKLVSFDFWHEAEGGGVNAEQLFHTAPVIRQRPALRDYFLINPGLIHGDPDLAKAVALFLLGEPIYQRALWESLITLRDGYHVGFVPRPDYIRPVKGVTLAMALDGVLGNSAHAFFNEAAASIEFRADETIGFMLEAPVSADEPRSLLEIFGTQAEPETRKGPIFSEALAALADRMAERFPTIHPRASPLREDITVHRPGRTYVLA